MRRADRRAPGGDSRTTAAPLYGAPDKPGVRLAVLEVAVPESDRGSADDYVSVVSWTMKANEARYAALLCVLFGPDEDLSEYPVNDATAQEASRDTHT